MVKSYLENINIKIENEKSFVILPFVESFFKNKLITWEMYHLFISYERDYGSITGRIIEGKFFFNGIYLSEFKIPSLPEEIIFFRIRDLMNELIDKSKTEEG